MVSFMLWFSLSLGIQEQIPLDYPVFTEIEIHAESELMDIYGIYKNEMEKSDSIYFSPLQDTFTVGAKIGNKNLSLNIEHMCSHAVNPYNQNRRPFDEGYNRLWVEISSK
jgi:hypothetical protein